MAHVYTIGVREGIGTGINIRTCFDPDTGNDSDVGVYFFHCFLFLRPDLSGEK